MQKSSETTEESPFVLNQALRTYRVVLPSHFVCFSFSGSHILHKYLNFIYLFTDPLPGSSVRTDLVSLFLVHTAFTGISQCHKKHVGETGKNGDFSSEIKW